MVKKIHTLTVDTSNMPSSRTARSVKILGDAGAKFSLMIRNEDDANMLDINLLGYDSNYYFRPVTGVVKGALKKVTIDSTGSYSFIQRFPEVTDDDKYDITIQAEEDTELSENIPVPRDNTGAILATYSIYQVLNLGQMTFGITTASSDWTAPFPADIIVKKKPEGSSPIKINWNLATTNTITKDRDPLFSNTDPTSSDFSGTAPIVDILKVSGAVNDSDEVALHNASSGAASVTGISVGMIVTGDEMPDDKTTVASIDTSAKTIALSQGVTLSERTFLNFDNGGAVIDFTTFEISDPYTLDIGGVDYNFIDVKAVGSILFGDQAFTCNLDLDSLTTLS